MLGMATKSTNQHGCKTVQVTFGTEAKYKHNKV